jgi:3-oxoacyl-[acyl-carrier-protein] synthase III
VIESLGIYLPPREVSTREIVEGCRKRVRLPIEKMSGITSRHVAGDTEFSIDLAKRAVSRCLSHSQYAPQDVDLLVCVNISRNDAPGFTVSYEPSTSLKLKHHFGFTHAVAFDLSSACSGMFTGIYLVDSLLKLGVIRRGLVVSGEYISHLASTAQKEIEELLDPRLACLTLGDSGAAVMLETARTPGVGFEAIDLRTFGRYADYCVASPTDQAHGGAIMLTDALKLTDAATNHGCSHALDTLARTGWAADSFQHLILHQTSRTGISSAMQEINRRVRARVCHPANTIDNLERRGNTATTTHLVALADNIARGRIRPGDRVVFAISGSGLTVGTALYTMDDLPARMDKGNCRHETSRSGPRPDPSSRWFPEGSPRIRVDSIGTSGPQKGLPADTRTLLARAAKDCLSRTSHRPDALDLVIHAGTYRSRFLTEPAIAAFLAGDLEAEFGREGSRQDRTLAFDVFNGAIAFLNACHLGVQMIRARRAAAVMVATAEVENNAGDFPSELLGLEEVGSAVVLAESPNGTDGFGGFLFRTFPNHEQAFISHLTNREGKAYLRISREPDLESRFATCIAETVREFLERERLDLSRVSAILPPQVSSRFITSLSSILGVSRDRMIEVDPGGGDLQSSSIPFALQHLEQSGRSRKGDVALMIAISPGIQVGCATYRF